MPSQGESGAHVIGRNILSFRRHTQDRCGFLDRKCLEQGELVLDTGQRPGRLMSIPCQRCECVGGGKRLKISPIKVGTNRKVLRIRERCGLARGYQSFHASL